MSLITLPSARWTQKPPPGTDLDRMHSLCPDHCWPFLSPQGTAQCLVRAIPLAAQVPGDIFAGGTSSSMVPSRKYGLSVRHGGTSDLLRLTAAANVEVDKVVPLSGGFTMVFAYRKTDATLRNSSVLGIPGAASTEFFGVHGLPWTDNNIYWRFGGTTEGTSQLTVAGASVTFGDDLWAFTTGPRGMECWQNGVLRGSNAGNSARVNNATNTLQWPGFGGVNSDFADLAFVMTWRRQLSAAEVRDLYRNPWQVFQPRPVMFAGSAVAATVVVGTGGVRFGGAAIITIPTRPVLTPSATRWTYVEDDLATAVDATIGLADADGSNITGATVQISTGYLSGEDLLEFTTQFGITASWNSGTGTLTLSGTTTRANYETALRSVTYRNTNEVTPTVAIRTVTFRVTDATALVSLAVTRDFVVVRRNDPPKLGNSTGVIVYTQGHGPLVLQTGVTVLDEDTAELTQATVAITQNYQPGEDQLSVATPGGLTWGWNAAAGVLTINGPASPAAMQAALRSVTYTNLHDDGELFLTVRRRTLVVTVSDT